MNTSDEAALILSFSLSPRQFRERDREKEREARFVLAAVWHGRISIAGESETVDEMMKDGGRQREREEREPKVEYR